MGVRERSALRVRQIVTAALVAAFASHDAWPQVSSSSTPKGGRSILMGNTGVAMARDGSAPFLNPATITNVYNPSVALSAHFLSYTNTRYDPWHAPGRVDETLLGPVQVRSASFSDSRIDIPPATLCLFATPPFLEKFRPRAAACLAALERDRAIFPAIAHGDGGQGTLVRLASSLRREWSRVHVGPTWAMEFGPLAVGTSLHGVFTEYDVSWGEHSVSSAAGRVNDTAFQWTSTGQSIDLALLLGLTYRVGSRWTAGASVQLPTLHIADRWRSAIAEQVTANEHRARLSTASGSFSAGPPPRIALGLGAKFGELNVEVNGTGQLPQSSALESSFEARTALVRGGTLGESSERGTVVERSELALGAGLGAEYFVRPDFSVLAGVSFDASAAPPIANTREPSLGAIHLQRETRLALSSGIGSYGASGDLLLGVQAGVGWGEAYALNTLVSPAELAKSEKSSFTVLVVLSGHASLTSLRKTLESVRDVVDDRR